MLMLVSEWRLFYKMISVVFFSTTRLRDFKGLDLSLAISLLVRFSLYSS